MKNPSPSLRDNRPERGDATRDRLLAAAIDVFGRNGFDATTTRALAHAAEVNLQAIGYYFGGKEGLYLAAADHIAKSVATHIGAVRENLEARLAAADGFGPRPSEAETRAMLADILAAMARLFTSRESEAWVRFMVHEQMAPTEAFDRVYTNAMRPILQVVGRLVARLLDEDPMSEHVRLRTLSLVGGLLILRVAQGAVEAHLGWKNFGAREIDAVQALARELAAGVVRQEEKP
ncbi:CerR family C-terminal domain-containing protein [Ciceribacter thiooxidans]|uniref:CerR family C-terminal domain-containing protein n=1 Tax=Ciceribacter thiooxidans TaxID=1969821 RepID=A0ABV7I2H2_9HYPH|nr:CerR family C-terminal domain-containing protein [Ciceribacter thiooxidans]